MFEMNNVFKMCPFHFVPVCSLSSNQLGDKGTVALAEALTVNHTLLSLQSVFYPSSITIDSAVCCYCVESPWLCVTGFKSWLLYSFLSGRLQSNSISNRGMTALTRALRMNRGLVSLKWVSHRNTHTAFLWWLESKLGWDATLQHVHLVQEKIVGLVRE